MFDVTAACIYIFHLFLQFYCVYYDLLPTWAFVILFLCTRTAQAGIGHYHLHRAKTGKKDWADYMFDNQYVGAAYVVYDGHVMLHHFYTNSDADVKRTVFTGVLSLPRLWRIPIFTLRRFGTVQFGMMIRWLMLF